MQTQQTNNSVPKHPAALQTPPPSKSGRQGPQNCPANTSELELFHLNPGLGTGGYFTPLLLQIQEEEERLGLEN